MNNITPPLKLHVIYGSTRQGRAGEPVANWIKETAETDDRFSVTYLDLNDWSMPFMDNPQHPAMGEYNHESVKQWSKQIAAADAFIIITPEYNHAPPAVLKNALDQVNVEWHDKPVGFVSYGGVAAGARAVEQLRAIAGELHLADVRDAVHVAWINDLDPATLPDRFGQSFSAMRDDLARWGAAFRTLRQSSDS